jgi:ribosome maturation factor RimP
MDTEKIKSIITPVVKSHGVEITDVSMRYLKSGALLKIYVDRKIEAPVPVPYPGSPVNLQLLEGLSREISSALEAYQAGGGRLILEVSSPGLDRLIAGDDEYKYFIHHSLKISLRLPLDGRRNFTGTLEAVEEQEGRAKTLTIQTTEGPAKLEVADIESARLSPQFPEPARPKKGKKKCHGK